MDESAEQLELPHFHVDGEDQWEMWTDPEPGETTTKCFWVFFYLAKVCKQISRIIFGFHAQVFGNSTTNLQKRLSCQIDEYQ